MSAAEAYVTLGVFLIGLAFGLRGSIRLTQRLHLARGVLEGRDRLILFAFVVVAWVITLFAIYIGVLSLRRAMGFAQFEWAHVVGAVLAAAVLFIPTFLDMVVDRVARS